MNNTNSSSVDLTFYLNTQLGTAICMIILSTVTIISNLLLLLTLYKDPLKCFRTPATYFIVALALVDFTTGVLTQTFLYNEPFVAIFHTVFGVSRTVQKFIPLWSFVVVRGPQLVVPLCAWSNLVAITFPHHYRSIVTTRRVLVCVVMTCMYFTGFISLQFGGVQFQTLIQVDLHLHSTLITFLLMLGSFMLLRSFRKFANTSWQLAARVRNSEHRHGRGQAWAARTKRISERQFTVVTLLLSGILIVCALPHIILIHIGFYMKQETQQERLDVEAVITIGDETMFLKIALDAFIYAWRLTKYRRSLQIVLACRANRVDPNTTDIRTMENSTSQEPKPVSSTSSSHS